jgi:hypothetical protein
MSQPSPNTVADLTTVFVQFASGFDTLNDRHGFLQQHPELLTTLAIDTANAYILDWRDNGYVKSSLIHLRVFRNLLKRAMVVGVDSAFLEAEPSREVTAAVAAVFRANAGNDLFSTLATNQKHLTSPQAIGAFNFMRAKFEDDADLLRHVEACWEAASMFGRDQK